MSFKRYPKYKDSGVEWLGEVPDLWSVVPLMRLTPDDRQIMYGIVLPGPHVEDGVPIVKGGDIVAERLNPLTLNRTTREIEAGFVRSRLRGGDIVYAIRGSIGEAAIVPPTLTGANITQDAARIAPKLGVDARWLLFAMQSQPVFTQLEQTVNGAAIRGINIWQLKRARIPLPSLSEQSSIAAFLDRETAKIDGLVAEQRRLIELLKEKRQAVISHAVTKGLNPDAPMKPSGIEWLGDVPEHWTLPPLYVRYEQVLGKMLDHGKLTGRHPTPYLRNADVRWDHVNVDDLPVMDIAPHERDRFTVRNGDLLMVEGRELGRCAIWQGDDGVIGFQKALHRLRRLDESEDARFFYYLMIFVNGTGAFVANQSPNEIPHLTGEELRRYRFPKPPYDEQVEIAEFLDSAARQFDALAAQSEHAIDLLQERRAALISAAVTGKIDIRDRAGVRPPAQRPYTSGFAIQLLAAEVLTQCHAEPTTGRVKLQKLIHLGEHVGRIGEIDASYVRRAAGPFDSKAMFGLTAGLLKQRWFQEVRDGDRSTYFPLEKAGGHQKYLARWADKMPEVHRVLRLLGKASTQQCEIVSTLYAAWNDFLIEGRSPSDAEIIHEASDPVRWHEDKAKIPPEKWPVALQWMRDHQLVPTGFGRHTRRPADAATPEHHDNDEGGG